MAQYHPAPGMWIPASTASVAQPPAAVGGMMQAPPAQFAPAAAPQFQYPVYSSRVPAPVSQPVAHPGGPVYYQQHPPAAAVPQTMSQPYPQSQITMQPPPMQPVPPQPVMHPVQPPAMQPQPVMQPAFQPGVQAPIQPSTMPMPAIGQAPPPPVAQAPMQAIPAPIQGTPAPGMQPSTYYSGSGLVQSSAVPMPPVNGTPVQIVHRGSPTPVRYRPVAVHAYQQVVSPVATPPLFTNAAVTATPQALEQPNPGAAAGTLVHLELPVAGTPDNSSATVSEAQEVSAEQVTTSSPPEERSTPALVDSNEAQIPLRPSSTPPTAVVQPMPSTPSSDTITQTTTSVVEYSPPVVSSPEPILQPPMPTATNPLRAASKARIEFHMDSSGIQMIMHETLQGFPCTELLTFMRYYWYQTVWFGSVYFFESWLTFNQC